MNNNENIGQATDMTAAQRTYGVKDIQSILGVSQPTAYSLVHRGLFQVVKVGRHIRVSKASFDMWLDGQTAEVPK
jgi:excisionase family DNA binding protein